MIAPRKLVLDVSDGESARAALAFAIFYARQLNCRVDFDFNGTPHSVAPGDYLAAALRAQFPELFTRRD